MPLPVHAREAGIVSTSRARALIPALGAAGAVAVATTVLHRSGGHGLGPLAGCWFHGLTGLQCPFCGSLRGVAALSYGDPLAALHDNAPVMLLLGVATLIWGRRLFYAATGKIVDQPRVGGGTYVALGLFFLAFTIYRNIPSGSWLAPLS
ncbi:MAG: DUF2752 domain-containing protein [Dermatophilaceae bacterium]